MDISILIQRDKEDEVNMRNLLALSEKKYNLQKELESLKAGLPAKQSELGKLQKEVVSLKTEVSVLEKQKEIAKSTAWNLMRQLVVEKAEVKKIQDDVWEKINGFVSDANAMLATHEKNAGHYEPQKNPEKEKQDRIRQLKLEGEIEAMQLYEKYQSAKIAELKLVRRLLDEDL